MSFWNIGGGFQSVSAVDSILDREEDPSLTTILESEDVLKEVITPNERLIEYLCKPQHLEELVSLVIEPPIKHNRRRRRSSAGANADSGDSHVNLSGNLSASASASQSKASGAEATTSSTSSNAGQGIETKATSKSKPRSKKAEEIIKKEGKQPIQSGSSSEDESDDTETGATDEEGADEGADSAQISASHGSDTDTDTDTETETETETATDDGSDSDSDYETPEEEERAMLARVATKVLSADVWSLSDALLSNRKALDKLWTALNLDDGEPEESEALTRQIAQFTSVIESLLEKRTEAMLEYIRTVPHFVDYFVRYVDSPPLIDFLLKVISTDHPDTPTEIIEFLYDQDLIPKMIARLGPDAPHSAQVATGEFLKAFVTMSGGNKPEQCAIGPNELSRQFVSEPCIRKLIELMLHGGTGMGIAVSVIIEVIRKNNSDYDDVQVLNTTLESNPPHPRDSIYLGTLVKLFAEAIPEFQKMLTAEHHETMEMPFGTIQPLGNERFRICELYAELLHCSNMGLLNDPQGEEVIRKRDEIRYQKYHVERLEPPAASEGLAGQGVTLPAPTSRRSSYTSTSSTTSNSSTDSNNSENSSDSGSNGGFSSGEEEEEQEAPASTSVQHSELSPDAIAPLSISSPVLSPPVLGQEAHGSDGLDTGSPDELALDAGDLDGEDERDDELGPNLTGPALEAYLADQEKQLRMTSVVGDKLKLALDDNSCISTVFGMLFHFPWNNFLHNVVFDIVQQVFNGPMNAGYNKFLAIHLFTRDNITKRIVQGQTASNSHETESGLRLGYVGHLTLISEEVVKFASMFSPDRISPAVALALKDSEWINYVDTALLKLREQYNTILGGRKLDGVEIELDLDHEEEEEGIDEPIMRVEGSDDEGDVEIEDHEGNILQDDGEGDSFFAEDAGPSSPSSPSSASSNSGSSSSSSDHSDSDEHDDDYDHDAGSGNVNTQDSKQGNVDQEPEGDGNVPENKSKFKSKSSSAKDNDGDVVEEKANHTVKHDSISDDRFSRYMGSELGVPLKDLSLGNENEEDGEAWVPVEQRGTVS